MGLDQGCNWPGPLTDKRAPNGQNHPPKAEPRGPNEPPMERPRGRHCIAFGGPPAPLAVIQQARGPPGPIAEAKAPNTRGRGRSKLGPGHIKTTVRRTE
jgi:hypothetical protein